MRHWFGRAVGSLTRAGGAAADLLFPPGCPGCDRPVSRDREDVWCQTCAEALLSLASQDACPRCGRTVGPYLVDPSGCPACRNEPRLLDGMTRVGPYSGLLGEVVRRYKYGRQQRLDAFLGSLLASSVRRAAWRSHVDALVPVPLEWRNRMRYRFDPVRRLAERVGRELALPVLPMIRVRGKTRRQVDLQRSERAENVRGVFRLRPHAHVRRAALCVIDDVCTSGSTLQEVARVLRQGGALQVYAAIVARAGVDPPGPRGAASR